MIEDLQVREYKDVVESSIDRSKSSESYIERYNHRRAFVALVCNESVKPMVVALRDSMT